MESRSGMNVDKPGTQPEKEKALNTVKRGRLWEPPQETFQTESELNGWRPAQAKLL